ncbi:MAG: hypothetical protein Q8R25_03230 [bacterium]|nr:hypothetical protein [bacterium]
MPRDTLYGQPIFMLEEKWQEKLSNLPESGMDYQIVDIYLKDGKVFEDVIVTGCRCFAIDAGFSLEDEDIQDITMSI